MSVNVLKHFAATVSVIRHLAEPSVEPAAEWTHTVQIMLRSRDLSVKLKADVSGRLEILSSLCVAGLQPHSV